MPDLPKQIMFDRFGTSSVQSQIPSFISGDRVVVGSKSRDEAINNCGANGVFEVGKLVA